MLTEEVLKAKLIVQEVERMAPLPVLLGRLAGREGIFMLGDFGWRGAGRFSYLGLAPAEVVIFKQDEQGDPFTLLDQSCRRYQLKGEADLPTPFAGGWVGYLSYDLGRYIERLPDEVEHDIPLPLLRFGFYDAIAAWDQEQSRGYLLALEYPGQKEAVPGRLARLRVVCEAGAEGKNLLKKSDSGPAVTIPQAAQLVGRMERNIAPEAYLAKVARSIEYIKAGDIFEVNISQRFACEYKESPAVLYEYLAHHNPAGFSALLPGANHAVVSASPELFLLRRGETITTKPIKGTAPRGANEAEDQKNRQWLLDSDKDRAELNMIIDLERNDLGRVCRYGTVKVLAEREIEEHPTVLHTVATIAGELRENVSNGDVLRATFPGGSITGAPKIRSMEIIDELEPTARSVYTGSIGWIGINGDMDLNIAIRTIILAGGKAYVQAGGAIVADSEPQAEYDETLAKAGALVQALWATKTKDK